MEPRFTIDTACNRLGISQPYFRKLLRKSGLEPIRLGRQSVYYTEKHVKTVDSLLQEDRKSVYIAAKNRIKALQYLENVPAGYTATTTGLYRFLGSKCSTISILESIDTVYEEELTHSLIIIGLSENHVFVTEETDEKTDELIKSLCISNEEVERLRRKNLSREVFTPARCAG